MDAIDLCFAAGLLLLSAWLAAVDLVERRIPDRYNLALAALGLARSLYHDPRIAVAAAAFGGAVLTLMTVVAAMRVAARLDHPVMEWGDVKFLAAAAFWVGFAGSVATFVIAGLAALAWLLAAAPRRGLDLHRDIALGPLLAFGLNLAFLTTELALPG